MLKATKKRLKDEIKVNQKSPEPVVTDDSTSPPPGTKADMQKRIADHIAKGVKFPSERKFTLNSNAIKKYFPSVDAKFNPPPKRTITLAPPGSKDNPILKTKDQSTFHPKVPFKTNIREKMRRKTNTAQYDFQVQKDSARQDKTV